MKPAIMNAFIKRIIRRKTWTSNKKAITQVLTPRCRRDGIPEHGRFTPKEIERVITQAESNTKELVPHFKDFDNPGNYYMEYGGLINLATYRALVKEGVDSDYAMNLVGDIIWQVLVNTKGIIPLVDPLKRKLARWRTRDPVAYLGKRLEDGLKSPFSEPGYKIKLYRDKDVYHEDIYSCPVYDFYAQFGQEEMTLFRKTWCTFDYAAAENLVEGGKYQREHTLSDGDDVCDMRWFITSESSD
ncbi:MAG: L-2-amino-thiazoline-4-carboxylic acid hydrolase [Candidatus Odinarchaeota archaeon]